MCAGAATYSLPLFLLFRNDSKVAAQCSDPNCKSPEKCINVFNYLDLIQGWVRSLPIEHFNFWPMILCPQGSSVAQLKATDPEGEPLIYGVSGEEAMKYFSVNKDTGVVWLRQQLDREVWGKHKLCLHIQITKANLLQKKETAFGGHFENDRRNVNHHMMKGQWMYTLLKEMKRTSEWHFNVRFPFCMAMPTLCWCLLLSPTDQVRDAGRVLREWHSGGKK